MENNLKLVCPKCGTPHQPHSPHTMDADGFERCEIRTVMEDRGWCYECSFWQNMYDKHKDDPGWVRIDGESWVLKPMVENVPSGWNSLGCGGRKMYINIEGKGIVVSNNCWCQGDVSDALSCANILSISPFLPQRNVPIYSVAITNTLYLQELFHCIDHWNILY